MTRLRAGPRAGFVLAEALVAFAVLAIGLGLIVTGMAVALRADGRAASTRAGLREAQARLARAGLAEPLVASDQRGTGPGGTRWRVTIAPVAPDRGGRPLPAVPAAPVPFWVDVTVVMPDGAEAALSGVKLGPAS